MGEHLAGVAAQEGDDLVFDLRQVHLSAVHAHDALFRVHLQAADIVDALFAFGHALAVAQRGADAGEQFLCAKGLGDIVVRAVIEGAHLVLFLPAGGDNHYRHAGPCAYIAEQLLPVAVGQAQIQQHQIRAVRGQHGHSRGRLARFQRGIARAGKHGAHEIADALVVLDDEYGGHVVTHAFLPPSLAA